MNKTMEYMAYALPSVCFDLVETRVSGADTVLYAAAGDVTAFTDHVERLLDDDELRVGLGLRARQRVCDALDWRQQAEVYVSVFRDLLGPVAQVPRPRAGAEAGRAAPDADRDELGRAYVDLDDPAALTAFVRDRGRRRPTEVLRPQPVPAEVRVPQPATEIVASTAR
jgi:hypothetical protein